MLQGHAVTLTFKVATQISVRHVISVWLLFLWNSSKIKLKMMLGVGHNFAARSCCNLDLQGSDPNVKRDIK